MKSRLALMVLATAAGAASAQSAVSIFGVMDAGLSRYSQNGVSKTLMTTSGNVGSRLGFRGTEDLGGGLTAGFWLEAGLLNDSGNGVGGGIDGGLKFNRRATVGLSNQWGEIRLGLDYTPTFWNGAVFDPFSIVGAGASSNLSAGGRAAVTNGGVSGSNPVTARNTPNMVQYWYGFAPNQGGGVPAAKNFYVQLAHAFAENASNAPNFAQYNGGRVGWSAPEFHVSVAMARSRSAAAPMIHFKEWNAAASYVTPIATLMGEVGVSDSDVLRQRFRHWHFGATIPAGPGYIPVSYGHVSQNNLTGSSANQIAVGYVYNFSKRTAVYGTYAHISNSNGGTWTFGGGNGSSPRLVGAGSGSGVDFGLRHTF